jgi:hypothetical protein
MDSPVEATWQAWARELCYAVLHISLMLQTDRQTDETGAKVPRGVGRKKPRRGPCPAYPSTLGAQMDFTVVAE